MYSKSVSNLIKKLKETTHGRLVRVFNYYLRKIYVFNFILSKIKEIGRREDTFYGRGL